MLLVTFHGGSGSSSINNVHVYDTPDGKHLTKDALGAPTHGKLSELRAMVLANGLLYVANGAKSQSTVLAYDLPSSGTSFTYAAPLIGPTLSKKGHFETALAHPFGIAFNGATCFISNQDTNVVGQVTVSNVEVETTVVDHDHGGLAVSFDSGKVKNSVRDVAIANGILFVCDEPDKVINLYSLADGSYLGSSNTLAGGPTHIAINNRGLYVSAGSTLYWGQLPPSTSSASLSLQTITPTPPSQGLKIGGISFDGASTVYVPYQLGVGGNNPGGSIYSYSVSQQYPPVLSNATPLVPSVKDTPEFVLYWSGGS